MAIVLKANNGNIDLTSVSGKVIRGIDGGYYTPVIDAEGNLSWIASIEDMEDIAAVNIMGPEGKQGETGPQGVPGKDGANGAPFTYDMFTEEQLAALVGPAGKDGAQGIQGPKGDKGDTGAAFTYDMFTEKQLEGLTGPQGEPGPKGDKGDKGDTGADGESPFVYSETAPEDTTKIWIAEDEDVEQIVYSDEIRKIIVVTEFPEVQEDDVLYVKLGG